MSTGMVCLKCRHYLVKQEWGCTCESPVPSLDARTPLPTREALRWLIDNGFAEPVRGVLADTTRAQGGSE